MNNAVLEPGDRVVVVGAGITGLTAAFELQRRGTDVTVLEAGSRAGGKVSAAEVGSVTVDTGPDGFLARDPSVAELCRQLGLGSEIVSQESSGAGIWWAGQLRLLPPSMLGVPFDAAALADSGLLSEHGQQALRRALAWDAPPLDRDATVGEVLRPRIGNETFERLVDPLIGGINAGSADRISIAACASPLYEAAKLGGPFGTAIRQVATDTGRLHAAGSGHHLTPATHNEAGRPDTTGGPVFQSVRGGTARIIAALTQALGDVVHLGTQVVALRQGPGQAGRPCWILVTQHGEINAARVIVTAPAFETARLIEPLAPAAADTLGSIDYSDVALVTFVVPCEHVTHPLDGSGFLVPRSEGLLMTACSWASSKWSHYRHPEHTVLRVSAGRTDDRRWLQLSPRELAAALAEELALTGIIGDPGDIPLAIDDTAPSRLRKRGTIAGSGDIPLAVDDTAPSRLRNPGTIAASGKIPLAIDEAAPSPGSAAISIRVTPWRCSLPQYLPGHLDRVAEVEAHLAEAAPGVIATGAAHRGLGLPACVRQARTAATAATTATAAATLAATSACLQ